MRNRIFSLVVASLFLAVSIGTTANAASTAVTQNPSSYTALGDSVAAGYGLPYAANATAGDKSCGRSPSSYATQVAATQHKTLINAACVGAKAGDLFTKQGVKGPNLGPQLTKAFAGGTPGLITITAGANDIHWSTYLKKCYAATCGTTIDTVVTDTLISILEFKYDVAMTAIYAKSNGAPPTVVLTGYYNPLSAACVTRQPRFTAAEASWTTGRLNALNAAIQRVGSRYSFTKYTPVDFTGHDICSADPWVLGPTVKGAFHPTAQGQQAIARAINSRL